MPYFWGVVLSFILSLLTFYVCILSRRFNRLHITLTATQLALAKEQKLSLFGALSAAAAHELGSPLSTISLATQEIVSSLSSNSPLMEDAQLVMSQVNRCRDILADLSKNIRQEGHQSHQILPLSGMIAMAAQFHVLPHISLLIQKETPDPEPSMAMTPDLLHGLGNILQNAFQFAKSTVRVTLRWDQGTIEALIQDDGQGYPPSMLPYLGQPKPPELQDTGAAKDASRKGGHMGLGLFIAKSLLSQRQAEVEFFNDDGARCLIRWPSTMRITNEDDKNQDSKS